MIRSYDDTISIILFACILFAIIGWMQLDEEIWLLS